MSQTFKSESKMKSKRTISKKFLNTGKKWQHQWEKSDVHVQRLQDVFKSRKAILVLSFSDYIRYIRSICRIKVKKILSNKGIIIEGR